jgi:hypothetical protein
MWSIEDVADLNPSDSSQEASFLARLLAMGASSEAMLIEFASELDLRGDATVAAFGQIPFDLGMGEFEIDAPGDIPSVIVKLHIRPMDISFDNLGKPTLTAHRLNPISRPTVTITQAIGVIRLAQKRARIHPIYVSRLNALHLLGDPLGNHKVENWMRLPEVQFAEPLRRKSPLTGFNFETDVAFRSRDHLAFAVNSVLHAYSVASLVRPPIRPYLYGFHIMIAPGRVAGAGRPEPILNGFLSLPRNDFETEAQLPDVFELVRNARVLEDPLVSRLQALHRLLGQGEPELAMVGCVTAIEWFLNSKFPELVEHRRDGKPRYAQLSKFLGSRYAKLLPPDAQEQLHHLVDERNTIAHGKPPQRYPNAGIDNVTTRRVRDALFLALHVYKIINLATSEKKTPSHETGAP